METYNQVGDDGSLVQSLETFASTLGVPVASLTNQAIVGWLKSNWAVVTLGTLAVGGTFVLIGYEVGKHKRARR